MHNIIRRDKAYFKIINSFDKFPTREANRGSQIQKLS
jgi:hypothetical protein